MVKKLMRIFILAFSISMMLSTNTFAYRTDNGDFNVKTYNATGNGTADDSTAIQNTINATQPNGGDIYFPKGTYRIASDIVFPANMNLVFEYGAVLLPDSGVTVTIDGSVDAGSYQIFTSEADKGIINGRMQVINIIPQWWGANGNDTKDDYEAIMRAIHCASGTETRNVYLPAGTYIVSATLDVTGKDRLNITGAGTDVTVIKTTSATADVFYVSSSAATTRWQRYEDFTIDSTVTRTAGAYFNFVGVTARFTIEDVKLYNWYKGIVFEAYENCWIYRTHITNPAAGADSAIQAGKTNTGASGANLYITDAFIRGCDGPDGVAHLYLGEPESVPKANYGIKILDTDAVFAVGCDIGGVILNDLYVAPSTRAGNLYFSNCYFDATKSGACVSFEGTGVKLQSSFDACWFASAGQLTGGSASVPGLDLTGSGSYAGVQFTGCRFFNSKGSGVKVRGTSGFNGMFTGCVVESNGSGAVAGENYGMMIDTGHNPSARVYSCIFYGNSGADIYTSPTSRNYVIDGCDLAGALTNLGSGKLIGDIASDASTDIASAGTITVYPYGTYYNITGTQNITGISATWKGHVITLRFTSSLAVVDDSQNLRLAGHFMATSNDTLTLICDGAEWIEVARSTN